MQKNSNTKILEQDAPQKVVEIEEKQSGDKKKHGKNKKHKSKKKSKEPKDKKDSLDHSLTKKKLNYSSDSLAYMIYTGIEDVFVDEDVYIEEENDNNNDDNDDEDIKDKLFDNNNCIKYVKAFSGETGQKVLCKIIDPYFIIYDPNNSYDQKTRQLSIINEALNAKKLDCPTIVKFLGINLYNHNIAFDDDDYEEYE